MDEKRLIKIIESNNEKLARLMDEKIMANNHRIADLMEMNNEALMLKLDKRFEKIEKDIKKLEAKVDNNKIYFQEIYGQKNKILFQKLTSNEQLQSIERNELDTYKKEQDVRFNLHDVRITKLEKLINA